MELATDIEKMTETLLGKAVPIQLGIVGVIYRSQEDVNAGKPIKEVLQFEKNYFQDKFPAIAHQQGIPYLAKKLCPILSKHIATHCPELKVTVYQISKPKSYFLYFYV